MSSSFPRSSSLQYNDNDEALLMKPIGTNKKRSLASLLSIDNHNHDEKVPSTLTSASAVMSSPPYKKQKQTRSNKIIDSQWILSVDNVPDLPFLYLKEKTSVVIMNQHPNDVAARIVDCAKLMNAYGQYDCQKVSLNDEKEMKYIVFLNHFYSYSLTHSTSIHHRRKQSYPSTTSPKIPTTQVQPHSLHPPPFSNSPFNSSK